MIFLKAYFKSFLAASQPFFRIKNAFRDEIKCKSFLTNPDEKKHWPWSRQLFSYKKNGYQTSDIGHQNHVFPKSKVAVFEIQIAVFEIRHRRKTAILVCEKLRLSNLSALQLNFV